MRRATLYQIIFLILVGVLAMFSDARADRAAPLTRVDAAEVVRRAVALGLPVALVSAEATDAGPGGDNVITDYRKLAGELVQLVPS